jgi:hypothetical protein
MKNNKLPAGFVFLLLLLAISSCNSKQQAVDNLIEKIMLSPDSLDDILAHERISKVYHDSIFVQYVLEQKIDFVKKIGTTYRIEKKFIVNHSHPIDDLEVTVKSESADRWLGFRFVWFMDEYWLTDISLHLAHLYPLPDA